MATSPLQPEGSAPRLRPLPLPRLHQPGRGWLLPSLQPLPRPLQERQVRPPPLRMRRRVQWQLLPLLQPRCPDSPPPPPLQPLPLLRQRVDLMLLLLWEEELLR